MIAVGDVSKSSAWYAKLLNAQTSHPGAAVFDQILDEDGTVLLCLHYWGPSGPQGDHYWAPFCRRDDGTGNGLLLWFVVDDFEAAWERAQEMGAAMEESPNNDNGTRMRAFVVRDPDGYYVAVNEGRH